MNDIFGKLFETLADQPVSMVLLCWVVVSVRREIECRRVVDRLQEAMSESNKLLGRMDQTIENIMRYFIGEGK